MHLFWAKHQKYDERYKEMIILYRNGTYAILAYIFCNGNGHPLPPIVLSEKKGNGICAS